jgi:hypothetical protein
MALGASVLVAALHVMLNSYAGVDAGCSTTFTGSWVERCSSLPVRDNCFYHVVSSLMLNYP